MSNKIYFSDRMMPIDKVALLGAGESLKKALEAMTKYSLGVCLFKSEEGELAGILTDGDLRRLILHVQNPLPALLISDALLFGSNSPQTIAADAEISFAIELMDKKRIWDLPVLGKQGEVIGLLNRHNLD